MKTPAQASSAAGVPRVSAWGVRIFASYARRYLRRHFHSVRVLRRASPPNLPERPLVLYVNHAAWWDPLVCLRLAQEWFPGRTSFAPIDSAMLAKYGFFKHLGFFGVEQNSSRGARQFLRHTRAILAAPQHALWITPQGEFADVRSRPLRLQPGLAALPDVAPHAAFVPVAIEYAFWTEPRPEILVSIGAPIIPVDEAPQPAATWQSRFTGALETLQDELAASSCRRDPAEWLALESGRSRVSSVYDSWRRLRAKLRGENFTAEHHSETAS